MSYYRELWMNGPVRNEARRLAKEKLKEEFNRKGYRFDHVSPPQQENAITVLLFNSEDFFLKRAKFNLGERK